MSRINIAILLILNLAIAVHAQEKPDDSSTLEFANGDAFSGELRKWEDNQITIKNPYIKNETTLRDATLLKLDLPTSGETTISNEEIDHEASIFIKGRHNQQRASDQLKGQLTQITDDLITLDTSYAGNITIDRKFITNMEISSKRSSIYSGPNSLEEWNLPDSEDAWFFRDGALIGGKKDGQISKDVGLDELSHISFNIDWKSSLNFRLFLFSNDAKKSRPTSYYELVINSRSFYMRKYHKEAGSESLATSDRSSRLDGSDTAFVEVFANSKQGIFHLYIDGEHSATFTDRAPDPDTFGSAIHFTNRVRSPMRLRNLRIATWSGTLPTAEEQETFAELKGEGQRILLKNGDAILGKLGEIKNGILVVDTKHTPIRIPVAGMRTVQMKGSFKEKHSPKMEKGDVKAYFKDGGWVIFKLESITNESITGYHQAFGTKTFDLSAFSQIEFNIYDRQLNAGRAAEIW